MNYLRQMPTRIVDIILSLFGLLILSPIIVITGMVCFFENRKPFFLQYRVGKHEKLFKIIKFRTMKVGTPSLPTHLVNTTSITKLGKFIRKLKIDELPQLLNVLKGEMSFVGPRPNLPTQTTLANYRRNLGIYEVRPGITGLSQISGLDMSDPLKLSEKDKEMLKNMSLSNYFKILILTVLGAGYGDRIKTS